MNLEPRQFHEGLVGSPFLEDAPDLRMPALLFVILGRHIHAEQARLSLSREIDSKPIESMLQPSELLRRGLTLTEKARRPDQRSKPETGLKAARGGAWPAFESVLVGPQIESDGATVLLPLFANHVRAKWA